MSQDWNNGIVETGAMQGWNDGIVENGAKVPVIHYSSIPLSYFWNDPNGSSKQ